MRLFLIALFFTCSQSLFAQESPPSPTEAAFAKGMDFLVKDAIQWRTDHNCASCHHASNVVWLMHEVKRVDRKVDETLLAELTKWLTESGDGKSSQPRPPAAPRALNTKALFFSLGLASVVERDETVETGLRRMLETVKQDQLDDGSWSAWPETRAPIFGESNLSVTALAAVTVSKAMEPNDEPTRMALDRAVQWLATAKADDELQSDAMRLVVWQQVQRPRAEIDSLVDQIKVRQRFDGGFSQIPSMDSDAWATGQALYALGVSGLKSNDPVVAKAQAFLVKTQREDGSWSMTSRPTKPGGAGSSSLIPITGGGCAWALMGLVRTL